MTEEELERLQLSRRNIEGSIDSLGNWLIGFVCLVVIGLAIELYQPVVSLARQFNTEVFIEFIGTLLVTVGVAGELAIEWSAHRKEKKLRKVNEDIQSDSDLKLSSANERIAALNLIAEEERLKRTHMEVRQRKSRIRFLNEEEQLRLKAAIRPYRGQEFFIITPTPPGGIPSEANEFGRQLREILASEGWRVASCSSPSILGQQFNSAVFPGMKITYGLKAEIAAAELWKTLHSFDILLMPIIQDTYRPLTLVIIDIGLAA